MSDSNGMGATVTALGVGGPTPGSAQVDKDTLVDPVQGPGEAALPSSFDEAMRDAELKVAEQQNREIFEREKRRRTVDEQTKNKLVKIEKGSSEHFEVLALRQKWTLPLDDDDYRMWMQRQMLEQHGGALADEAAQRRIGKAKAAARGPAIAVAVLALVAGVAALGWWVRGRSTGPEVSPAVVETAGAPTRAPAAERAAPTAKAAEPASAATGVAASAEPPGAAAAPSAAAATPPPSAKPAAAPTTGAPPRPAAPSGKPPSKDIWEREF